MVLRSLRSIGRGLGVGLAAAFLAGCGSGGVVAPSTGTPVPPSATMPEPVEADATVPTPTPPSPLDAIPASVREEVDLFAFATLQIQRVKQLQNRSVQKKLKLTDEQIAVFSAVNAEVDELSATLQRLKPDEREHKLRNEFRPKAGEYGTMVDQQLDAGQQRVLFQEVLRRQRGAIIFLLPGVPEELQLTDAQLAKLYTMIEETRQAVDFDNLQYNPLEIAKLLARATAARNAAEAQLTPEQRAKFDRLMGD